MNNKRNKLNLQEFEEIYLQTKSVNETAEHFKISYATTIKMLKEMNIHVNWTKIDRINDEEFVRFYSKCNSIPETMKKFGLSEPTVIKKLKEHGLYVKKKNFEDTVDIIEFCEIYEKLRSLKKMGEHYGVSPTPIKRVLIKYNIEIKRHYIEQEIIDNFKKTNSIKSTAKELNVSKNTITKILEKHNIEKKTCKRIKIGDMFGMLTIVEFVRNHISSGGHAHKIYLCKCECGNTTTFRSNALTSKKDGRRDCGCVYRNKLEECKKKKEIKREQDKIKLIEKENKRLERENKRLERGKLFRYSIGDKRGRLEILEIKKTATNKVFIVKCECGNIKEKKNEPFGSTSCGCLQRERSSTHGQCSRNDPERRKWYDRWKGMLRRCYNPKMHAYHNYGGRGIRVCDRWQEPNGAGSENYYNDIHEILGPQPSPDHSLDRIDNDGMYEISNLRWSTNSEQTKNQRRNLKQKAHYTNYKLDL
jgi:hypothetical protein